MAKTGKRELYKITKIGQGFEDYYYIRIPKAAMCEGLLDSIGENTPGGHSYGYKIKSRIIKRLPSGSSLLNRKRIITIY